MDRCFKFDVVPGTATDRNYKITTRVVTSLGMCDMHEKSHFFAGHVETRDTSKTPSPFLTISFQGTS